MSVIYLGMNAVDFDSSGSNQEHKVRAFPVGTESPLDDISPRPGLSVGSHVVHQMADHTDGRTTETVRHESFDTSVVTGVRQS